MDRVKGKGSGHPTPDSRLLKRHMPAQAGLGICISYPGFLLLLRIWPIIQPFMPNFSSDPNLIQQTLFPRSPSWQSGVNKPLNVRWVQRKALLARNPWTGCDV